MSLSALSTGMKPVWPDQSQEGFSRSEKQPRARYSVILGFSSVRTFGFFPEAEDFEQMEVMILFCFENNWLLQRKETEKDKASVLKSTCALETHLGSNVCFRSAKSSLWDI